jgi:hypothetical protein
MSVFETAFPPLLAELHKLPFDYASGKGIEFEPYEEFQSASENASWIQAWTGNRDLTGSEYRIFGQDGTGGYAAFWLVRPNAELLDQPIVFFGSEGELGVVARNFVDYLWLLAGGFGPFEAIAYPGLDREPNDAFTAFAKKHSMAVKKPPGAVIAEARSEFPSFEKDFLGLCRYGSGL